MGGHCGKPTVVSPTIVSPTIVSPTSFGPSGKEGERRNSIRVDEVESALVKDSQGGDAGNNTIRRLYDDLCASSSNIKRSSRDGRRSFVAESEV